MACRQYYDGLCTGGTCEICPRCEVTTAEQIAFKKSLPFTIALFGVSCMMTIAAIVLWTVFG